MPHEEPSSSGSISDHDHRSESARNLGESKGVAEAFVELTRIVQLRFPIHKGLLILRETNGFRYSAVATFKEGSIRLNLNLYLQSGSSLFEKVAVQGRVYTENYCGLFSGSAFERALLLDDMSCSFVIQPLNHDGQVVGLVGYSSIYPDAFALCEEGALDRICHSLCDEINRARQVRSAESAGPFKTGS